MVSQIFSDKIEKKEKEEILSIWENYLKIPLYDSDEFLYKLKDIAESLPDGFGAIILKRGAYTEKYRQFVINFLKDKNNGLSPEAKFGLLSLVLVPSYSEEVAEKVRKDEEYFHELPFREQMDMNAQKAILSDACSIILNDDDMLMNAHIDGISKEFYGGFDELLGGLYPCVDKEFGEKHIRKIAWKRLELFSKINDNKKLKAYLKRFSRPCITFYRDRDAVGGDDSTALSELGALFYPPTKETLEIFMKFLKNPDPEIAGPALICVNSVTPIKPEAKTPTEAIKYIENNMEKIISEFSDDPPEAAEEKK
jgi:hypothetical protein